MAVRAASWLHERVEEWRSGSVRAQWTVAAVLLLLIAGSFVVSLVNRGLMPLTAYFLRLLVARVLLSFRPLLVVAAVDAVLGALSLLLADGMTGLRWVAIAEFVVAVVIVVYIAARARSDLPSTLSEALLG